jgi:exodeoxyribonuclease VII small subunit
MATKKTEVSFEENIKELENTVRALEGGEVSLEEMLRIFGEGIRRTKECTEQLQKAEQKITVLMRNSDGEMKEEKFGEL